MKWKGNTSCSDQTSPGNTKNDKKPPKQDSQTPSKDLKPVLPAYKVRVPPTQQWHFMVNNWHGTEAKALSDPRYIHLRICFKTNTST